MTIKICGMTRREDAVRAAELGVHAVGFVFWTGSPRAISPEAARVIVDLLPPFVTPVGVFVDPTAAELDAVRRTAGIRVAQIVGRVPLDMAADTIVLRAVHLAEHGSGVVPDVPGAATVLVDACDPVRRGGTGRTIDWARVAPIAATRRVILAGGLTPLNVREAIRVARPYGVDVSSGVEQAPGIKDHDKLAAFVAAVRAEGR